MHVSSFGSRHRRRTLVTPKRWSVPGRILPSCDQGFQQRELGRQADEQQSGSSAWNAQLAARRYNRSVRHFHLSGSRLARPGQVVWCPATRLPGYKIRLDETRKNAARRNRIHDSFARLFGGGGLERGYRNAMCRLVKSYRSQIRFDRTEFRTSGIQRRLVWRYSTMNEGVARFNGALKNLAKPLTTPRAEDDFEQERRCVPKIPRL